MMATIESKAAQGRTAAEFRLQLHQHSSTTCFIDSRATFPTLYLKHSTFQGAEEGPNSFLHQLPPSCEKGLVVSAGADVAEASVLPEDFRTQRSPEKVLKQLSGQDLLS